MVMGHWVHESDLILIEGLRYLLASISKGLTNHGREHSLCGGKKRDVDQGATSKYLILDVGQLLSLDIIASLVRRRL